MRIPHSPLMSLLLSPIVAVGCSSDYKGAEYAGYVDTGASADYGTSDGSLGGGADTGTSDDGLGSEDENGFVALAPASTNVYVFIANPDRNTVTRVNAASLDVLTTEVGVNPQAVATAPDYQTAVTFNQGTDDVSIIDAETMAVSTVEVRENLNAMEMSPDGEWVICYHDIDADSSSSGGGSSSGAESSAEISLVNILSQVEHPMTVGPNPHDVVFSEDSHLAVVVSDAYLTVVDLTASDPQPNWIRIADATDPPAAEEVVLSADGHFAIVRQYGTDELVLVDLQTDEVSSLVTGANPTDIDVTPDGSQALAVARGSNEVWSYDLADPYATPTVLELPDTGVFGSLVLTPDGTHALLYSTQSGLSLYADWNRETDEVTTYGLPKPVSGVALSPTGGTALIFHPKSNGDLDPGSEYYNHYALTMVDLADFFPHTLRLDGEPIAWANSEDGLRGFLIMDGQPYLEELDYDSLLHEDIALKSDPVHVGVMPDSTMVYVSQQHDLGRISFYDYETGVLQTITGFELNSGISD